MLGVVSHVQRAEAAAPVLAPCSTDATSSLGIPGCPSMRSSRRRGGHLVCGKRPARPATGSCCGVTPSTLPAEWRERVPRRCHPDPAVDVRHYRAIAPFMRERWRGRFGIDMPVEMPDGLSWRQQRTFLSLCPAVVATGTTALEALAFATPLVTDTPTARLLAGTDGVDMRVCDGDQASAATMASALGADHRTAAAIGHAGRRLVEEVHDLSVVAATVARRWAGRHLARCSRTSPTSRPCPVATDHTSRSPHREAGRA